MKPEWMRQDSAYDGCTTGFEEANVVLIGAGYDGTSSYRAGSRFAPQAIRAETLWSQETYSPYFDTDLLDLAIHDAGDLDLPIGNKEQALRMIRDSAEMLVDSGKKPLFLGGEHLVSLPVVESLLRRHSGLTIVQLDAHLDLMDELFGERISHGTVMRRCLEQLTGGDLYQVGVRSGSREEYDFARQSTRLYPFGVTEFCAAASAIGSGPVYLSLDLDVFDPSLLPGTGTPEAGGIFFGDFIQLLEAVRELNIVGADVVELSPRIDPTNASTIVAAKVVRETIMVLA